MQGDGSRRDSSFNKLELGDFVILQHDADTDGISDLFTTVGDISVAMITSFPATRSQCRISVMCHDGIIRHLEDFEVTLFQSRSDV